MPNLTDTSIRAAKPNSMLWDSSLRGFGLRSGKERKTFIVLIGSGRRQAIGTYPFLSLSDARTEAKRILAEKALGLVRPKHVAYEDARDEFLAECESRLRPLTVRLYRRHLTVHYPFGRSGVADIVPRQIVKQLNWLHDRPSEKEHAYRISHAFFVWCKRQHLIDRNPMEDIAVPPVGAARDRVLTEEELRAVFRVAWTCATPFHRLVALLLLLGLRRMEAAQLQWGWFEQHTRTLTIPGQYTKNKRTLVLPYGSAVSELLAKTPRYSDTYLFPAARDRVRGKSATVMTGFSDPKRLFDREAGVHGWTLHDCRRVVAVGLQKLGARLETIEALLNHVSGSRSGIVGVYQRYDFQPELRVAVEKWEVHLRNMLHTEPPT